MWQHKCFHVTVMAMLVCAVQSPGQVPVFPSHHDAGNNESEPRPANAGNPATGGSARLWEPVEWSFRSNATFGNPYDVVAKATFTHAVSNERIVTELFYDKDAVWKLRFTGTRTGRWSFVTASDVADLNGLSGTITIDPNPGVAGFMTSYGNKWGRLGLDEAFVPQLVSYISPRELAGKPEMIDADIQTWFSEHGFNGVHTIVACAWFDLDRTRSNEIDSADPNPDPRTFEAMELLIGKVHAAGGVVHLWAWGDQQRKMTPVKWGLNGSVDQRLQRYICARLGPLPGWSVGYGFDLQEWVKPEDLRTWHEYMHAHLGWSHLLGARAPELEQIYDGLDYSSYQQHRPTYDIYVEAIERRHPGKPTFLEDRFRIRQDKRYADKDYTQDMTRRGLWDSMMAGGAANIWACLFTSENEPGGMVRSEQTSLPYPNRHQILTYARFWRNRFHKEMVRDNSLTDGVCLKVPDSFYVFYKEDTSSIAMHLAGMNEPHWAVAVDTLKEYEELPLGRLEPGVDRSFKAPYVSDWAVVVGDPDPARPVRIDLGVVDAEQGLFRLQPPSFKTAVAEQGGLLCRGPSNGSEQQGIAFNVAGSFAHQGRRPKVDVTIAYFDASPATLRLWYDATDAPDKQGGSVALTGTHTWKEHTFHIADAYFGHRGPHGADLRIAEEQGRPFYLKTVSMSAEASAQPAAQ